MYGCVNCGYCCRVRPCSYGEWDPDKQQCTQLTEDDHCALHAEIVEKEKHSPYPMFGNYCSSAFMNTVREAKIKEMKNGETG
jgi:hypothetical protein